MKHFRVLVYRQCEYGLKKISNVLLVDIFNTNFLTGCVCFAGVFSAGLPDEVTTGAATAIPFSMPKSSMRIRSVICIVWQMGSMGLIARETGNMPININRVR